MLPSSCSVQAVTGPAPPPPVNKNAFLLACSARGARFRPSSEFTQLAYKVVAGQVQPPCKENARQQHAVQSELRRQTEHGVPQLGLPVEARVS